MARPLVSKFVVGSSSIQTFDAPSCEGCERRATLLSRRQVANANVSDGAQRHLFEQRLEFRASAPDRRVETKVFEHGQVSFQSVQMATVGDVAAMLERQRLELAAPPGDHPGRRRRKPG